MRPAEEKEKIAEMDTELLKMTIGSCTCRTKTPDHTCHNKCCRYRLLTEARLALEKL